MEKRIDPTKINQAPVDTGQELTPDGNLIQQAAAPTADKPIPAQQQPVPEEVTPTPEPEKEVTPEKTKEVDFLDFIKAKSTQEDVPAPQKEDTLQVVPKPDQPNQQKHIQTAPKSDTQQSSARDYTGFDEEEAKLLRSMSNDSFNHFKPKLLEHKKLATEVERLKKAEIELNEIKTKGNRLPDSIYEHEQAFVLNPEFIEQSQNTNTSGMILEHWQNQLAKIDEGAAQFDMIGFSPEGKLVITGKVPAGPEAKQTIQSYIRGAEMQHIDQQTKLRMLIAGHSAKHQESKQWLTNFQGQFLGVFDKPESKAQYEPIVKQAIDKFHPAFRSNPLATPLAKAMLVIAYLTQQQPQSQVGAGPQASKPKVSQQRKAGPTIADVGAASDGGSGEGNGKSEVTYDDFERAKQGY